MVVYVSLVYVKKIILIKQKLTVFSLSDCHRCTNINWKQSIKSLINWCILDITQTNLNCLKTRFLFLFIFDTLFKKQKKCLIKDVKCWLPPLSKGHLSLPSQEFLSTVDILTFTLSDIILCVSKSEEVPFTGKQITLEALERLSLMVCAVHVKRNYS